MTDNLYSVRRFKEKLLQEKPPDLELQEGDLIVNTETGESLVVMEITDGGQTLLPIVRAFVGGQRSKGVHTITLSRLRSKHRRGLFKIYKGKKSA